MHIIVECKYLALIYSIFPENKTKLYKSSSSMVINDYKN